MTINPNLDPSTVASFGDEWKRFDQQGMAPDEAERVFGDDFAIFPWEQLPPNAEGFDMGCGSGPGPASWPPAWAGCTASILPAPWL